jgi:Raf kinase inhibitor-like YbhB/YbcL family protein
MSFEITSTAFKNKENIPEKYTCDGENNSPPLSWKSLPKNTKSLVLIVDDPDAPDPRNPRTTWVHWVVYDINPTLKGLNENVVLIKNGVQGINDFKEVSYGGPCPPIGKHRYFFKLYALDTRLNLSEGKSKKEIKKAMKDHILEKVELIGLYRKK